MRGSFRIVARQCHIPASALPVDRIERHERQISIRHPFEEGNALSLEVYLLRISKVFGFVNGDGLRSHICHIFIVMRVVGFAFHADFRIEFLAFLFRLLCDFILHVGHIVVTRGERGKKDAVHIKVGPCLHPCAKEEADDELCDFFLHAVLLISR